MANDRNASDYISPETWRIVAVATLGPFLSTLDSTVVNVSLSGLATELKTNLNVIQSVASAYLLALALVPRVATIADLRVQDIRVRRCPTLERTMTKALHSPGYAALLKEMSALSCSLQLIFHRFS